MTKPAIEGQRKDKLKHVALTDIIFEDRARSDMGNMEELKASIQEKGIIQPITLNASNKLLAGGRRYTAATELGLLTIPCIIRDTEDEVDEKEIELIENVYRQDFSWQERAALTKRIDDMYRAKNPDHSLRATARLLDKAPSQTSREIQLAKAIEKVPEIGNCKTADDAFKVIKKLEETAIRQIMRERQQEAIESSHQADGLDKGIASALRMADQSYIISDVFEGLAALRGNTGITIIECDPPYGVDLNEQKAGRESVTSTVTGYEEVPREEYVAFLDRLTSELYRVANKDCWLVFWYGQSWHQAVLDSLRRAGWQVDEIPAVWVKPHGQTLQPELYYARCWEPFFLCRKGKPVMAERGRSNVFAFAGAKNKYHPTQRPTELIEAIFKTLSVGQDKVLVPFLGSGATLRTVFNMGLTGFGFDLDGKYKDQFMLAVEEDTRSLFAEGE